MRLALSVIPRTLHFKQPAGTSRGVYRERRTWYVQVTSPDVPQLFGLGECAPLPDLSCDFDAHYETRLRTICAEVERNGLDKEAVRPFPSILFGLETALLSAEASLRGDCLHLFDTPFTRGEAGIPINGLVWMGDYEEMLARMEEKLAQGFRCIKLKIGAIDFEREVALLARLRSRFSPHDVALRVDANGAFRPEEAVEKLARLAQFGLHSIEQPIRAGQWEALAQLCRTSPIPIALDEELIGVHTPAEKQRLLDTIRPQFIVLKPSLHGGLTGATEWATEAQRRGIGYWITSALESNVGLNAIAQWTGTLPASPIVHQGLGTGQLFTDNFEGTELCIDGESLWRGSPQTRAFRTRLRAFEAAWHDASPTLEVQTSGSTGTPQKLHVEKARMAASARATLDVLGLKAGETALLCLPLDFIAGKMMAVRAFVGGLRLKAVAPSSHPFAEVCTAPAFVALTPMQAFATLQVARERRLLRDVRQLIIGGGSVSPELEEALRDFPNAVWSTYGMTETLSHIALRRLNGAEASACYRPLPGVRLSTAADGCLLVEAPHLCPQPLTTHDLVELHADGSFCVLGRKDNVICSGGIKLQIEAMEARLHDLPFACLITSVPDAALGEAVVLLYEGETDAETVRQACAERLGRYEQPKHLGSVERLPRTETGKPARAAAKALAHTLFLC